MQESAETMVDEGRGPKVGDAAKRRQADEQARLAAALRENLLKRKLQSRERMTSSDDKPCEGLD